MQYLRHLTCLVGCLLAVSAFSYDEEAKEEFFLSTPEQVALLSSEPSGLVGGLVSPLSGQLVLRQTDLTAKGAQDIVLNRIYIPPYMPISFATCKNNREEWEKYHLYQHVAHNYKGWQFYPHLKLQFSPNLGQVLLTDSDGRSLSFHVSDSTTTLSSPSYALSNISGDTPNGKYDPRNTRISYETNEERITVYAADGATLLYDKQGWTSQDEQLYFLKKEILPNGKILKYHYSQEGHPNYIESVDPQERFTYAFIKINGSPWEGSCYFTSSSGLTANYNYQRRPIHVRIQEKVVHWYGNDRSQAEYNFVCPPILSFVSSPSYRNESLDYCGKFLLSVYSGKNAVFRSEQAGFGDDIQHFMVHKLFLPVGQNDAFIPVYELTYQPPVAGQKGGTTTIKNSDGTSTVYHFSQNLLTTLIQYFGQDGHLKKEKAFSWDEKNWLKALEIRDEQTILSKKSYEYDRFGNPVLELFTADLTGEGNLETLVTKRTFSEEGRNLLLREEEEDGKVICFSYLPNTNLITSKPLYRTIF